jgi:transposase
MRPADVPPGGEQVGQTHFLAQTPPFVTPEFKAEIVDLCLRGDRSVGQVAWDFRLAETTIRQAERDSRARDVGTLSRAGPKELTQLRREHLLLSEDVEMRERATAFFASMARS